MDDRNNNNFFVFFSFNLFSFHFPHNWPRMERIASKQNGQKRFPGLERPKPTEFCLLFFLSFLSGRFSFNAMHGFFWIRFSCFVRTLLLFLFATVWLVLQVYCFDSITIVVSVIHTVVVVVQIVKAIIGIVLNWKNTPIVLLTPLNL